MMARSSISLLSVCFLLLLSTSPSHEFGVVVFASNHLETYGYLSRDYGTSVGEGDDEALASALRTYQTFFRLNVTGRIEPDTLASMMEARCGVPDIQSRDHGGVTPQYSFFPGRPTWPPSKRSLSYGFSTPLILPVGTMRGVLGSAFREWSSVSKFTFQYGESDNQDIHIGFYVGAHGDEYPFDGPGGVLAHAFHPTIGFFHFDADDQWSTNPDATQYDLESISLHEIGHLLGLGHSKDIEAVMYPTFRKGELRRVLQSDDIDGINALYPDE